MANMTVLVLRASVIQCYEREVKNDNQRFH